MTEIRKPIQDFLEKNQIDLNPLVHSDPMLMGVVLATLEVKLMSSRPTYFQDLEESTRGLMIICKEDKGLLGLLENISNNAINCGKNFLESVVEYKQKEPITHEQQSALDTAPVKPELKILPKEDFTLGH